METKKPLKASSNCLCDSKQYIKLPTITVCQNRKLANSTEQFSSYVFRNVFKMSLFEFIV